MSIHRQRISGEITPQEKDAGFKLIKISNPYAGYFWEPPIIDAVVYRAGDFDRILKCRAPNENWMYVHQRHGLWAFHDENSLPAWLPLNVPPSDSPFHAVTTAEQHIRQQFDPKILAVLSPDRTINSRHIYTTP